MTIADMHRGFLGALTTGQVNRLAEFVDPDAYTENSEAARRQILGDTPPADTPVDYAINAPPGHRKARTAV